MRSFEPRAKTSATPADLLLGAGTAATPAAHWRSSFHEIIGRSPGMLKVLETVAKVAPSDSSVLIQGESGTGKELIAHAIHRLSHRAAGAYVPLNSSAIPENLLESELFGHERGAFTGADKRKAGKFEYAHRGTLFLDEIGDMPVALQAKLLRVLQDKKFARLGGNELIDADVRIVAATNMDLSHAVASGGFRLDLFYRLNVLPVVIPPLRERTEDIPALLDHFVEAANRLAVGKDPSFLTDGALDALCRYAWPGNVRQLSNLVERLVVMSGGGAIDVADLPPDVCEARSAIGARAAGMPMSQPLPTQTAAQHARSNTPRASLTVPRGGMPAPQAPQDFATLPSEGIDLPRFIEDLENTLIREALARTGNNRNQAAKLLGLNRTTLVERIKKRKIAALNEPSKEL